MEAEAERARVEACGTGARIKRVEGGGAPHTPSTRGRSRRYRLEQKAKAEERREYLKKEVQERYEIASLGFLAEAFEAIRADAEEVAQAQAQEAAKKRLFARTEKMKAEEAAAPSFCQG